MSIWLFLFPFFSSDFHFSNPFLFLSSSDLSFSTIHLKQKKGLGTNSSPRDKPHWGSGSVCRNAGQVCYSWNKSRALLVTHTEKKPLQKAAPHHPALFSISVLPSTQSCILIILSEPTAHSNGREPRRKEALVAPLKGKRCRPYPGQRSGSDPAEKKPQPESRVRGTVICSEEGNKGHCVSAPLKRQPKQSSSFSLPTVRTNCYQPGRETAPPPGQTQV